MTESDLTRAVRVAVKKAYPLAFIWKIADQWTHGIPDFLFIINGVHIFFELKAKNGTVSKIQEWTLYKIKESGGNIFICRTVQEVLFCIEQTLTERR